MEVEHLKVDRTKNIAKIQELRKEMNAKEAEQVKASKKFNSELESIKEQVIKYA